MSLPLLLRTLILSWGPIFTTSGLNRTLSHRPLLSTPSLWGLGPQRASFKGETVQSPALSIWLSCRLGTCSYVNSPSLRRVGHVWGVSDVLCFHVHPPSVHRVRSIEGDCAQHETLKTLALFLAALVTWLRIISIPASEAAVFSPAEWRWSQPFASYGLPVGVSLKLPCRHSLVLSLLIIDSCMQRDGRPGVLQICSHRHQSHPYFPPPPRYCNLSLVPFRGLKDLRSLGQELAVVMACEDCSADPGAPTFGGMALAMDIFYHSHHFCPSARLGLGQIVLLCYR